MVARVHRVKFEKQLKKVGAFYSTLNLLNVRKNIFFVDKINVLKEQTNMGSLLDLNYADPNYIDQILRKTTLKRINIYKVPLKAPENEKELIMDFSFQLNESIKEINFFSRSTNINAKSEPEPLSVISEESSILTNTTGVTAFSFIDLNNRTKIKDDFRYDIELEFYDGLTSFLKGKLEDIRRKREFFTKLISSLSQEKYLISQEFSGGSKEASFDIGAINRELPKRFYNNNDDLSFSGTTNLSFIQRKIKTHIIVFLDMLYIMAPKTKNRLKTSYDILSNDLNLRSTTLEKITDFHNNFEKIYERYEKLVNKQFLRLESFDLSPSAKKSKTSKNAIFYFKTPIITNEINKNKVEFLRLKDMSNSISYLAPNALTNLTSVDGTLINKRIFIGNTFYSTIDNQSIKQAIIESSLNKEESSVQPIKTIKYDRQVSGLNIVSNDRFRAKTNSLLALTDIGITFPSNKSETKTKQISNSQTVESQNYLNDKQNTFNSDRREKRSDNKQIEQQLEEITEVLKFSDTYDDIIIAKILDDGSLTSNRVRPASYGNFINNYILKARVEYLAEFTTNNTQRSNSLNPVWVPVNQETLTKVNQGSSLLCRIVNEYNYKVRLDIERIMNLSLANSFFILKR